METIRFRSEDVKEIDFGRDVRKKVRDYFQEMNLSTYGNAKMYLKTVVLLGLYILPFVAVLVFDLHPLAALAMAVLMGIGEAGVGMSVMHDAAHGAYSSKKWINRLFSGTMYLLGTNTFNWKVQHTIRHHTYTNIYNYDPDISTKAVIRLCEHADLRKYHRFQHIYAFILYGLMTLLKMFTDIATLVGYNKEGTTKMQKASPVKEVVKLAVTKVIYLAAIIGLPLIFTNFSIWQILLGFSVMHLTAGMIMSTVFQMAHVVEGAYQPIPDPQNKIPSDWAVHEMKSTSDFGRNNGFLSWYIGGLDYQIEHHLFPHICHVHYPTIAPIVEKVAKKHDVPYNFKPSFWNALVSHYRRLRELGRLAPAMA